MEGHSFGYWLRLKRKALDLTREGLAARVGCSAATVQKLEEEERRPSAQIVARLAEIFQVPEVEQAAFLRFARGDMGSVFARTVEGSSWSKSPAVTRSNLPSPVTSIIGREQEMADIRDYLASADVRLVTLVGPPGIGKTRLSIETGRTALTAFPEGVFFVPLAPLDDPSLLPATVAQALGYVGARNISSDEQIREAIGDKRMLIVLDNCEHLVEYAASFVSALLSVCPRLRILTTSREALRVHGEWLYPVPPLAVPDNGLPFDDVMAGHYPVLTLFAERARAVQPNFQLNAQNVRAVTAICRQLDGLPLAVELIAARVRTMPPQALLERLGASSLSLAEGMRAVEPRQKSLSNAIDWSYRMLSQEEQRLLACLSVFSGGFTVAAAETIFARLFTDKTVTELITSFLDKSLLQRAFGDGNEGEPQYSMLVTIREFARQPLRETGQEPTIRDWHLEYFLDLADRADHELRGANQVKWLHRIDVMRDNLRAALDWAVESGQTERAMKLVRSLWWFWSMRSEFNEGRQWLGRVLAMPEAPSFPLLYADVLTQQAHHTYLQMGAQEAKPAIEQALAIVRAHGQQDNQQTLASTLMVWGLVVTLEGDFAHAEAALEESGHIFQELRDRWGHALVLMSLGYMEYKRREHVKALTLIQTALAAFRELGDQHFQSVCLYEVGSLQARGGDWEGGFARLRESLLLAREIGSTYEIGSGLLRLAESEQYLGRPGRAVRLYCAAKNVSDSVGAWQPKDNPRLEDYLAVCRAALDEEEYVTALDEGCAMTLRQALEYALGL